jgi:hypothetical protein
MPSDHLGTRSPTSQNFRRLAMDVSLSQTVDCGIPETCPDTGRHVATAASQNPILISLSRLPGR